jgi:hypothetical protein
MRVSREKLFEAVWKEPMVRVAERYGVSSSFMARVCTRLRVPRPYRGYWMRIQAGERIPRMTLPELLPGDPSEWVRGKEDLGSPPARALPKAPVDTNAVKLPRRKGTRVHPLVDGAELLFQAARESEQEFLLPKKRLLPDVSVSRAQLTRALSWASDIYNAFANAGHRVLVAAHREWLSRAHVNHRPGTVGYFGRAWIPGRPTVAMVGTVAVGITVYEAAEGTRVTIKDGKWVRAIGAPRGSFNDLMRPLACGRLGVRLYSADPRADWQHEWLEGQGVTLGVIRDQVVTVAAAAAPTLAKRVQDWEQDAEARQKALKASRTAEERVRAEQRTQKNVVASMKDLVAAIAHWSEVKRVHEFIADVERDLGRAPEGDRPVLSAKLEKARALVAPMDALGRLRAWLPPDER